MMAANTEGKAMTKDFEKLVCSNTYAKPMQAKEVINILTAVSNVVVALAGGKPCITLMGYAYVPKPMHTHTRLIVINKEQAERFLVKLL